MVKIKDGFRRPHFIDGPEPNSGGHNLSTGETTRASCEKILTSALGGDAITRKKFMDVWTDGRTYGRTDGLRAVPVWVKLYLSVELKMYSSRFQILSQ